VEPKVAKAGADGPLVAPGFTAELESLRGCIETMVRQVNIVTAELKEQEEFTNTAINSHRRRLLRSGPGGRFVLWNDTDGSPGWSRPDSA